LAAERCRHEVSLAPPKYTKQEAHAAAVMPALAGYPPGCCPPRGRCPDRSRRHRRGGCGFAVTEQLGLALGNPAVTDITVPIVTEKSDHQLQLQELLLAATRFSTTATHRTEP
jgi:hypothetical protein